MSNIKYLLIGIFFGIALTKGEAISWYRIQEMFRFESFHMYGIFMTAIPTGVISLWLIRKWNVKTTNGDPIEMPTKHWHKGIIFGSLIFGCGWALTGACPGPLYAQTGAGYTVTLVTLLSAIGGTWTFAKFQHLFPD